jgi:protein CpxP
MTMRTLSRALCLALALVAPAGVVSAQAPQPQRQAQPQPVSAERDSLERRVRVRMSQLLRTQLGLSDDQMRKLQAANGRFEVRRRELFQQERNVRGELREAMRTGDTTDNAAISSLLDRMIAVQRQRVELMESEQRELATFLTPLQRAKYFGMEEQIRRRVMEMRDGDRQGQSQRRMLTPPGGAPRGDGKRPPPGARTPG